MEKGSYKVLCFLWKVQHFQALWRFLFPWRNLNSYILVEAFQPSGKNCLWMWLKIQGTNTRHVCQKPALAHIYVRQWDRGYLLLSQVHVHKGKPSSASSGCHISVSWPLSHCWCIVSYAISHSFTVVDTDWPQGTLPFVMSLFMCVSELLREPR